MIKKNKYGFLIRFLLKLLVMGGIFFLVLTYVLTFYRATGNSMFPSVKDGDLCILYKLEDSHTNDVVLYRAKDGKKKLGRIVAVGDQEVDFPEEGGYTVNGYQPAEEITYETYKDENSDVSFPVTLGTDEYFILNDFRSDTSDSREYSTLKKKDIEGKLIFILRRRGF